MCVLLLCVILRASVRFVVVVWVIVCVCVCVRLLVWFRICVWYSVCVDVCGGVCGCERGCVCAMCVSCGGGCEYVWFGV